MELNSENIAPQAGKEVAKNLPKKVLKAEKYLAVPVESTFTDYEKVYVEAVERAKSGAVFVEIGAFLGKSAVLMAELIRQSGKKIAFHTIDPFVAKAKLDPKTGLYGWGGSENFYHPETEFLFRKFVEEAGYTEDINLIVKYSEHAIPDFEDESVDFVFVDGAHDYPNGYHDVTAWYKKLKPGGMLAGHDYAPNLDWTSGLLHGIWQAFKDLGVTYQVDPSCNCFFIYKPL